MGAGLALFAVIAGVLVARSSGERLPDQPASGSIAATGTTADLRRAQRLIGQGKTLDAMREALRARDERLQMMLAGIAH